MRTYVNPNKLDKWLFVSHFSGGGDLQTNNWLLIKAFKSELSLEEPSLI